jgi:hypothetical protein
MEAGAKTGAHDWKWWMGDDAVTPDEKCHEVWIGHGRKWHGTWSTSGLGVEMTIQMEVTGNPQGGGPGGGGRVNWRMRGRTPGRR